MAYRSDESLLLSEGSNNTDVVHRLANKPINRSSAGGEQQLIG